MNFSKGIPAPKRFRMRLGFFSVLLMLMLIMGNRAFAQSYLFSVPELRMQSFIQPDGSATIVYDITFQNQSGGQPIDIVDIGMPHEGYDLSNMSASIGNVPLGDIRPSEFVDPGVEVHLYEQSIQPGQSGTLHFMYTIPEMVYQDTTRDDYASYQITPTWFEPEFVLGTTKLQIVIHMLPEILPDEVLSQDVPFTDKFLFEEHVVVGWQMDTRLTGENVVGVSFPKRVMTKVIEQNLLDLALKWLEDNPGTRFILGAFTILFFAVAYFRFSGWTGLTLFVILAGIIVFFLYRNPLSLLILLPLSIVAIVVNEFFLSGRKKQYLPAVAQVEGGGIKRGLTAPEAAIILELPLNKILTLVIFGLLEKNAVSQIQDTPLKVEISPEYRSSEKDAGKRKNARLKVAQDLGVVLRTYEHPFLDLIEEYPDKPLHEIDFSEPMRKMIKQAAAKIKGFDLSDTQDYYRKIIARAMKEAKRIGEIPQRERYLDRHLQWLLLDRDYPTVFTTRGYHYRPIWIRPFTSADRVAPSSIGTPGRTVPSGGRTSFSDVAASFAGWTENTMGKMANAIAPGALQMRAPDGGFVNLSGIDRVTGDVFKAMSSSSGGSGGSGGGGSCACACAGCACACACAGGGR